MLKIIEDLSLEAFHYGISCTISILSLSVHFLKDKEKHRKKTLYLIR